MMGLQYLTDRPELRRDRGKIFDEIQKGIIKKENIESSDFYHKIQDRVHFLPLPEKMLDSNDTVFKYNKKSNVYSMIEADYLMKNHMDGKIYFCFYLMQEMIVIFVVLFSQRRKWIIQRIKLHGLFYIRKKEILLMGQNIYYTTSKD